MAKKFRIFFIKYPLHQRLNEKNIGAILGQLTINFIERDSESDLNYIYRDIESDLNYI